MSKFRFNHFFLALLLISALTAFILPPRISSAPRGHLDPLFSPVASPVRKLASVLHRQVVPVERKAQPAPADARQEIDRLKSRLASLELQIAEYERLNKSRDLLGDAEKYSKPFRVLGADGAYRDTLLLEGSSGDGLQPGMEVLYSNMLIGKVVTVGTGGAQVRLITDRGFTFEGAIGYVASDNEKQQGLQMRELPTVIVEGRGSGVMKIANLTTKEVHEAGVKPGDSVYLRDPQWPLLLSGYLIGEIVKIESHPKAVLFAEITVRPATVPTQLREAMVLMQRTRQASAPAADAAVAKRP